jgi:hypothetical protein
MGVHAGEEETPVEKSEEEAPKKKVRAPRERNSDWNTV